jgi:hypothetical protein
VRRLHGAVVAEAQSVHKFLGRLRTQLSGLASLVGGIERQLPGVREELLQVILALAARSLRKTPNRRCFSHESAIFLRFEAFRAKNGLAGWPRIVDLGRSQAFGRRK